MPKSTPISTTNVFLHEQINCTYTSQHCEMIDLPSTVLALPHVQSARWNLLSRPKHLCALSHSARSRVNPKPYSLPSLVEDHISPLRAKLHTCFYPALLSTLHLLHLGRSPEMVDNTMYSIRSFGHHKLFSRGYSSAVSAGLSGKECACDKHVSPNSQPLGLETRKANC